MIRGISLVARHEFVETVRTKSFLISLVLIPLLMSAGMFVPQWLSSHTSVTRNVAIVDLTEEARYGDMLAQEIKRDYARNALTEITSYARAYAFPEFKTDQGLDPEKVPPLLLKRRSDFTDADADAFLNNGGLVWAMSIAAPFVKPGSPPPVLEPETLRLVDVPDDLAKADLRGAPADHLRPWLIGEQSVTVPGSDKPETLTAVVLIQPDAAPAQPGSLSALGYAEPGQSVQIWSNGALPESLVMRLPRAVDTVFQKTALVAYAGDPEVLERMDYRAPIRELDISAKDGRELTAADMIARILPRALSVVLIYFLYINMFMLMNNTMEEKSSRIIEVLVSSVTPNQLLIGKLLGSSLVALTMFAFSVGMFLAVIMLAGGSNFVEFAGILLDVFSKQPILPALFVYFVLGYFLFAGIFLTLGAFCETSRDVQNMSTPMVLVMMVVPFVVWAVADDPNGSGAQLLSWMPFFGPFMMMARATSEPPMLDIVGSVLVQLLTIAVLLWASGKIFRIAVLSSGKPKFGQLIKLVRQGG
ncbi:hypothetical protein JCM17844_10410 [Iodidimonas gelatinilytica]|uniref:ABC-2 type transporter transmembrane domain-containing protein n=1 Tax=Iodidimonas gelatinilytica TaxID=1236966 RepID=A0A5A7N3A1_9PROT|nr:ABC transporter permease [Iodidimonas gelatinilytica]GEQ97404.1 hypothetical protein JCM17844_10410 [Iodidimonas gelatinilytica]GER02155.1 hypothetical protein JCM17845_27780 [Iodidimonas gelatinilytica]